MCKTNGSPKAFQTKYHQLAKIKAERLTQHHKKQFRVYYCRFCFHYCITSQPLKTPFNALNKNSKKRRKLKMRPQICDWENEGGSFAE